VVHLTVERSQNICWCICIKQAAATIGGGRLKSWGCYLSSLHLGESGCMLHWRKILKKIVQFGAKNSIILTTSYWTMNCRISKLQLFFAHCCNRVTALLEYLNLISCSMHPTVLLSPHSETEDRSSWNFWISSSNTIFINYFVLAVVKGARTSPPLPPVAYKQLQNNVNHLKGSQWYL